MKNQKTLTSPGVKENHAQNKYKSRRELLEASRLSRLPSLPKCAEFNPENACVNCKTELTEENQKVKSANVCAACVSVFAVVASEFDRAADRKSREARLARFGGAL